MAKKMARDGQEQDKNGKRPLATGSSSSSSSSNFHTYAALLVLGVIGLATIELRRQRSTRATRLSAHPPTARMIAFPLMAVLLRISSSSPSQAAR